MLLRSTLRDQKYQSAIQGVIVMYIILFRKVPLLVWCGTKKYVFFSLLYSVLFTSPAYAYLDPGTGAMILQGIIAAIAVGGVAIASFWKRIKSFWKRIKSFFHRESIRHMVSDQVKEQTQKDLDTKS